VLDDGESVEYVEVVLEDIAMANRLAGEVLGRSLDELAPQTRRLLLMVEEMVTEACARLGLDRSDYRFTRREVRDYTGWGHTQLKVHLHRLEELEYLILHRGGRGQQFVYELFYDGEGKDGRPFLPGLLEVARLRAGGYDPDRSGVPVGWSGLGSEKSGGGRGQVGAKSAGGRPGAVAGNGRPGAAFLEAPGEPAGNAVSGKGETPIVVAGGSK
jgi:hypothetical protein